VWVSLGEKSNNVFMGWQVYFWQILTCKSISGKSISGRNFWQKFLAEISGRNPSLICIHQDPFHSISQKIY